MKLFISIFFLFSLSISIFAQQDAQLAMEYFNDKEFAKAESLFEKLYKSNNNKFYYEYFIDCLVEQKKFSEAEKSIQKEIKKNPADLTFYIDLGFVFKSQNNETEADKQFKYVLKNIPPDFNKIVQIGNSFIRRKEYSYAEKTYQRGNEFYSNQFLQYLANVYASQRKYYEMIETYLDYALNDYSKIKVLQDVFTSYMSFDVNNEFSDILQKSLILRVQKATNDVYDELLIWFYTQKTMYAEALIYAKAIDKRKKENGVRIINIADLAFANKNYSVANSGYTYVVEKGAILPYYNNARFSLLKVTYQQVIDGEITDAVQLKNIENQYLDIIQEMGVNQKSVDIIIDLSHLQAFYLNKEKEGIDLLTEASNIPNISPALKAAFLLELGNIYVKKGELWDAVVSFAKIEENYPSLEIADLAKLQKAKTYFYLNQFTWAQNQWDVLKGSPSKLIANDALYWSHFLSENLGADSTQAAMKMFAKVNLYIYQGEFLKANLSADTIIKNYSSETIIPAVYFLKYEISYKTKEYQKAAMNLQYIIDNYNYDTNCDKYVFLLAELYEYKLNDKVKASEYYKKVLFDFGGSIYTEPARKKYREISGA